MVLINRLEYDAYRSDLDFYSSAPKTDVNAAKQRETQVGFKIIQLLYCSNRGDNVVVAAFVALVMVRARKKR